MILGVVTVLAYVLFILIVHNVTFFNSVGTMVFTFSSLRIWLIFFFICATCGLIDFTILSFHYAFDRSITTLLQLLFNSNGIINDKEDVPDEAKEKLKIISKYEDDDDSEHEDNKNTNKSKINETKFRDEPSNNNLLNQKDQNSLLKMKKNENSKKKTTFSEKSSRNSSERSSFIGIFI